MLQISLILIICVIVGFVWNRLNKIYLGDFFSPFNLLLYFWVLPFLASYMMLSELQVGLTLEATLIIIVSTMIMVFISMMPMFKLNRNSLIICYSNNSLGQIRKGAWFVVFFYLLTFAALYWAEYSDEKIVLFQYLSGNATDPGLHRIGKDSKLQVIAAGISVAGMLCFFLGINSISLISRIFFLGLAIFVPILGVLKTSKSDVFTPVLIYSALLYYHFRSKNKRIPKWPIILLMVITLLMILMTDIRVEGVGYQGGYAKMIGFKYSEELGFPLNEIIANIYGYVSLGFQNFSNYVVHGTDDFRIGTSLFRPFLSALMQGDVARALDVSYDESYMRLGPANVGTYLRDLYIEGGAAFCIIGSIIYAVLVNAIYIKFRIKGGVWMFIYIAFLFPWVWIFFQNAFSILQIYVNAFYVFAIYSLAIFLGRNRPATLVASPLV